MKYFFILHEVLFNYKSLLETGQEAGFFAEKYNIYNKKKKKEKNKQKY